MAVKATESKIYDSKWFHMFDVTVAKVGGGHEMVSRTCIATLRVLWQYSFMNFRLVSPFRKSGLLTPDLTIQQAKWFKSSSRVSGDN